MDKTPPICWNDIAGLDFVKKTIKEIVIWPMLRPYVKLIFKILLFLVERIKILIKFINASIYRKAYQLIRLLIKYFTS